ncbi:MAG TPA: alpha/beta hydrolase [Pseudomonadota bacterium]|nr:alpha/beta hydrolase [Pseudomonadota bacterium]
MPKETIPKDIWVTAQDGLKLHVRQWGPQAASALSVVCLPGLARTVADFDPLATAIAGDAAAPRRVFALDSRGRGKSQYDRNPENYNLNVELADLLAVLTALDIGEAVFIGTSRGGILAMRLAAVRPTAIAGCVLNDIGPVIEPKGLARIKSYVGKLPWPASYRDGADMLQKLFGSQFPKLTGDDWLAFARRTFKQEGTRLVPDYDVKLATTLETVDLEQALPTMWKELAALARVPVLVLRGVKSDILSSATVEEMKARHPGIKAIEIPDQGHAPLLSEPPVMSDIAAFIRSCESSRPG